MRHARTQVNGKPLLKESQKPKKERKKSISKLKKELDAVFSQYIRRKYANEKGEVRCYTCPKMLPWKQIQNGHFVSRSALSTRYDEANCRPQCPGCNIFGRGQTARFGFNLDMELGSGTVSSLYRKAQEIIKDFPYQEKITYYKSLLNELPNKA